MRKRAPKVSAIRIVQRSQLTFEQSKTPQPFLYWNESRSDWTKNDGTHYKTLGAAFAAIKRFKLTNCTPCS